MNLLVDVHEVDIVDVPRGLWICPETHRRLSAQLRGTENGALPRARFSKSDEDRLYKDLALITRKKVEPAHPLLTPTGHRVFEMYGEHQFVSASLVRALLNRPDLFPESWKDGAEMVFPLERFYSPILYMNPNPPLSVICMRWGKQGFDIQDISLDRSWAGKWVVVYETEQVSMPLPRAA